MCKTAKRKVFFSIRHAGFVIPLAMKGLRVFSTDAPPMAAATPA
jgi:hypothetical protein